MIDEEFKKIVLKSLIRLLDDRLNILVEHKKYNGTIDKEILDTRNDLKRYKDMLEEING